MSHVLVRREVKESVCARGLDAQARPCVGSECRARWHDARPLHFARHTPEFVCDGIMPDREAP